MEGAVAGKRRGGLGGLYIRHIGANVFGISAVITLNFFTPTDVLEAAKRFVFTQGGWTHLAPFYLAVTLLIGVCQFLIQRPIAQTLFRLDGGEAPPRDLLLPSERRLLNLPFLLGALDLGLWVVLPLALGLISPVVSLMPANAPLFLYSRTVLVGLIASTITFFLVEDYSRSHLVPLFFPGGRLTDVPGIIRVTIRQRIRVLYAAGTAVPLVALVTTLLFTLQDSDHSPGAAAQLGWEVFGFVLALCGIFVLVAFRLNVLVERSVRGPLREMLQVVREVRKGNFGQRVPVVSNDETGELGDAANEMIHGLAERERIRETFGKYVTPEVRDLILSGRVPLDGARAVATLLFSDLRGFTAYVEKNPPETVIRSMREYFTAMQTAVHAHGGLVLQYVGDEVEAVFGGPLPQEDHADRAVRAALEMRARLAAINRERERQGLQPFRHGIGLHTGEVLAGTVGSEDRLCYALIGDTVNLASRIESLTKELKCDILASEATVTRLKGSFRIGKRFSRSVAGREAPVTVYEILSAAGGHGAHGEG